MSRSLPTSKYLRRAVAAAALVCAAASLTACGDSSTAATSEVQPDNANTTAHGIHIDNIQLVVDPSASDRVAVTASIVNDSKHADTLTGVRISGVSAPVRLSPAKGSGDTVKAPVGTLVRLGGRNEASAIADGTVPTGAYKKVTFTFANAGSASVHVSTHSATGALKSDGPTPATSPSATGGSGGRSAGSGENASGDSADGGADGNGTQGHTPGDKATGDKATGKQGATPDGTGSPSAPASDDTQR